MEQKTPNICVKDKLYKVIRKTIYCCIYNIYKCIICNNNSTARKARWNRVIKK